jgi:hypothetical protein
MAENLPKDLEVRLTELENAVKALTDASKVGANIQAPIICSGCGLTCVICHPCGPVCQPCRPVCQPCRPICTECTCGPCTPM